LKLKSACVVVVFMPLSIAAQDNGGMSFETDIAKPQRGKVLWVMRPA